MLLINFSNRQRKVKLPSDFKNLLTSCVKASLDVEGVCSPSEVSITFVGDEYEVNPENGRILLGDVIISVEHALSQASAFGHSFEREMAYLTVHSLFHLMGYAHVDEGEEKRIMRGKEEAALSLIGLQII